MYLTLTGLILAREPLGEYDVKLTMLTRQEGKLTVRARGARRLKAKVARHLGVGAQTTLELARLGDSNLAIGSNGSRELVRTDSYPHFVAGTKLLALAERLAPIASPEPEIFSVLIIGLERIRQSSTDTVSLILDDMKNQLIKRAGWKSADQIPNISGFEFLGTHPVDGS